MRIGAAGVCHSDLSVIDGTIPFPPPVVLGHEGAGVVEAVGSEVRSVKAGDHVVIATLASCGTCRACGTGHPTWCRRSLGQHRHALHLQGRAHPQLRRRLGLRRGHRGRRGPGRPHPLRRPAHLGLPHRLRRAHRRRRRAQPGPGPAGQTAAVFGVGGVGLNVIQGLRIAGATRIVAVDTVAPRSRWPGSSGPPTSSTPATATRRPPCGRCSRPTRAPRAPFPRAGPRGPSTAWATRPCCAARSTPRLGGNAVAIGIPPRGTEVSVDVNALAYVDRGLLGNRYGSAAAPPRRAAHDRPLPVRRLLLDELVSLTRPLERFGDVVDEMHAGRVARGCSPSTAVRDAPALGAVLMVAR